MMPEVIRERLETLDLQEYKEAKEYAIWQARNLKKTSKTSTLDLHEEEEEMDEKKKTRFQEEAQEEADDDILAYFYQ